MANPGMSGPVEDSIRSVHIKGYLKYSRSKLTPAQPMKAVAPKLLCLAAVGRKCLFFPLNFPSRGRPLYGSTSVSPYQKSYAAILQLELFQQPLLLNNVHISKPLIPCF